MLNTSKRQHQRQQLQQA